MRSAPAAGVLPVASFHERFHAIEQALTAANTAADRLEQLAVMSLFRSRAVVLHAQTCEAHHVDRVVSAVYPISRLVLAIAGCDRLVG